jgi:ornithine cyclodeaminase
MAPTLLSEQEIRGLIGPGEALEAVREAFAALARERAETPAVIIIEIPESRGEVHVKGAHLGGSPYYAVKFASVFADNPAMGLPVAGGLVLAFDAKTGRLAGVLLENGFLTDLRTGAVGALAADLLAKRETKQVGIIGTGAQGRYQLEALLGVRRPQRVLAYDRSAAAAAAYAADMRACHGISVSAVEGAHDAVEHSDLVICSTPSREAYLRPEWVSAGTHITAMGSDNPAKQELFPEILGLADKVVVDNLEQCLSKGELHHAVEHGVMVPAQVYAELGEIAAGLKPGRTSESEITVADLTGIGAQDTAVASRVLCSALAAGTGTDLRWS